MNKSIATNLLALSITIIGVFSPLYSEQILTAGLFALSGSITNWLAVHMLFEKVPFLYGSGIIVRRYNELKQLKKKKKNQADAIKKLYPNSKDWLSQIT